jgi:ribonucleoside-diphosphate reductase alpha chain
MLTASARTELLSVNGNGRINVDLTVTKRSGEVVSFDINRIEKALMACMILDLEYENDKAELSAKSVAKQVKNLLCFEKQPVGVESIQNLVEAQLMAYGYYDVAKQYILFRDEKRRLREAADIPDAVVQAFKANDHYFQHEIQKFQALDKFARYDYKLGRRETWPETVKRVINYFNWHCNNKGYLITSSVWEMLEKGLLNLKASPSMRCVQMAGPALERCQVGVYNCSFQFLQSTRDLAEELYVLMQGTGVGFSVEYEYATEKFPRIKRQKKDVEVVTHVIADTTEGWCEAYRIGLDTWWAGHDIKFDFSKIREAGTPLKIKGGKASGPGPLKDLLEFARNRILSRQGKALSSLDLHDINCYAHRIVRMGGVRRASGISLTDLSDIEMRDCKHGQFWTHDEQRNQANNSAVYTEKPDPLVWMEEWLALARSGSGERGIFNRGALKSQFPKRRKTRGHLFGTNPCGEIILRHKQFCNLSIAVIRPNDTMDEIKEKVILATIWGTLQSTMTDFCYIGEEWKKNSEEERLLGVDLLGFLDHPIFQDDEQAGPALEELRDLVNQTNEEWAEMLNIPVSAATTCIKPSGDSSVFFGTAAGFKGHHGEYYLRRVRANSTNPVAQMLKDEGVPCLTDYDGSGLVLEFPMKTPEHGVLLKTQTALSQLEKWKTFKKHWTEHNPSVTIYVRPEEWLDVGKWVYDNWDIVGGLSFLPYDGGMYPLAPYEAITKEDYDKRVASFPVVNWAKLVRYEKSDMTDLHQQVACAGGACEI